MSARPAVALWGAASLDNVGDRALFDTVQAGLQARLPGVHVARFCPWSEGGRNGSLWVDRNGDWPGRGRFDAVVMVGGVFAGPPFVNVLMQAFTLGPDPAAFDPQVLVAWHGVGLDDTTPPADRPGWQRYLRALAERVDRFTVRGPNAVARFADAGARLPRLVPDPVFALPPRPGAGSTAGRPAGGRTGALITGRGRPRVAVAVAESMPSSRFMAAVTDTGAVLRYVRRCGFDPQTCLRLEDILGLELRQEELVRAGAFGVRLRQEVADVAGVAEVDLIALDNMYDDGRTASRLADEMPYAPVRSLPAADADTVTDLFGEYDVVIASRLHSLVLAARAGVATVAVDPYWNAGASTSKVRQLMDRLGVGDRHSTLSGDGPSLAQMVLQAVAEPAREPAGYLSAHLAAVAELDALAADVTAHRDGVGAGHGSHERELRWR